MLSTEACGILVGETVGEEKTLTPRSISIACAAAIIESKAIFTHTP